MGFTDLLLYATPVFFLSMWLEYKLDGGGGKSVYTKKDLKINLTMGAIDVFFALVVSASVAGMLYFFYTSFEHIRYSWFGYRHIGWSVWAWLLSFLLDDFTYYWFHRTSHRVRLLWACHIVHHSSTQFNFSTAIRNSWIPVMYKPVFWIWLAMVGFHPLMILTCMSAGAFYQFFCHTEKLSAWNTLSFLLTTPGIHAIHHGKEELCIDKNYAGVFIFIDRIFGTYQPIDPKMKVTFGVTHPPRTENVVEVNIHEFRNLVFAVQKARNFSDKLKCLVKGPEWKPKPIKTNPSTSRKSFRERLETDIG